MSLDLLDLLLIVSFCFDRPVPWWLWVLGVLATTGAQIRINKITDAIRGR